MANPKLAMIPTGYKAGKVYSVLPESGVGDFTFDRDSKATRVNEDGLIEVMDNDVPRLDYTDGGCPSLLLEPESTNLETKSNGFSTWAVNSNITRTVDYIISPDGTLNGTRLQFTANGFSANTAQVSSVQNTVSCYAKRNDSGTQSVGFFKDGSGTVDSAWSLTSDWKRFTYTYTAGSSFGYVGIAGVSGADVSVYGFQLEESSYPTSYIPTNGSTVTRVGETCDDAGDVSTFNDSEGVLMAEIAANSKGGGYKLISLTDSTSGNSFISIGMMVNTTESYKQIRFSGVNLFSDYTDPINQTDFNKIAIKYKSGNSSFYVNGFEIDSSSVTYTPNAALSELKFSYFNGSDDFYGNTKQIQYFDSALTDLEIETLTSWQSFLEMANGQNYTII